MIRIAEPGFAATDRECVDPVRGDQAVRVEIRNALVELGVSRVLDGEVCVRVIYVGEDVGALRFRAIVKRFGESVTDVDREPMRGRMAQGELQRVVGTVADRVHGVDRGELVAPKCGLFGAKWSSIKRLRKDFGRCELVAASTGINEIGGLGQIDSLEQVMAKPAYVCFF